MNDKNINNNLKYRFNKSNNLIDIDDCNKLIETNNIEYLNEGLQAKIYQIKNNTCGSIIIKKIKEEKKSNIESFYRELKIYKLTNNLIYDNICPHFLLMYGSDEKKFSTYIEYIDGTLLDFFSLINNEDIINSAIFQILYGLMVVQKKLKVFHSDLHIKNIFYKKINNEIKFFKYIIEDLVYLVPNYGYLVIIGDFGHAECLTDTDYNSMNKKDIEFAIQYNYDFNMIKIKYNKLLKENISGLITNFEDLNKYVDKINEFKNLYPKYKTEIVNKYPNLTDDDKEKKTIDLLIYHGIEKKLFDMSKLKKKFIHKIPNKEILNKINNIFNSKKDIRDIIKDNYYFVFNSNNMNNISINEIKVFNYFEKKNHKLKLNMSRMETNNIGTEIEKIKQVYQKTELVIKDDKMITNYHTRLNRNFIPEQILPMYSDIEEYDYIKPIIKLNSRYSNSYYGKLIKYYDYDKKNRLDLYSGTKLDKTDLDEIMLQYIKCKPKCFVITLWPIFSDYLNDMVEYLKTQGKIYYVKKINFTKTGLINYFASVYDEFSNTDILKIAQDKYSWSRLPEQNTNTISIIIFDNVQNLELSGQGSKFKKIIRNWGIELLKKKSNYSNKYKNIRGNDIIHINDYFYQTIEYCQMLLNHNSISLLDNRLYSKIYDDFYSITHLKIETYRKSIYLNLSLETINSLFLMAGALLYFYGFRPIGDLDGICVNMDSQYENKTDLKSEDIKKVEKLFANKDTRIFYIDFGITNSKYWRENWSKSHLMITNFFGFDKFEDICWNPNLHLYFKGVKCYLIDFEFYRKLQRTNDKINKGLISTLSKDYTDYIMINNLNPKLIEKFIYINKADGKLKVSKSILDEYPVLSNLKFNNKILELINKFLISKYKPYLSSKINDKYIKSLF